MRDPSESRSTCRHACRIPTHGYYRRRAAIGSGGDFITAPEISQVFGELIGLWCAVVWQQMGEPRALRLVELGPGRGTLMRDLLRAARTASPFHAALQIHLVETNAALESQQRAALLSESVPIRWSSDFDQPDGGTPTIVIANEFLDTLPIAQWVFRAGRWHPRCVGLDADGKLAFVDGDPVGDPASPGVETTPRDGDVFETRAEPLAAFAAKLATLGRPMAALFIDYGHVRTALGDTLQAVSGHRYEDPLCAPGEADVTAQVDFAAVAAAMQARDLVCDGPLPQAAFLGGLGVVERASRLMAANPGQAAEIETAIARLIAPVGMGSRFCALGVRSKDVAPLPGLSAVDNGLRAP